MLATSSYAAVRVRRSFRPFLSKTWKEANAILPEPIPEAHVKLAVDVGSSLVELTAGFATFICLGAVVPALLGSGDGDAKPPAVPQPQGCSFKLPPCPAGQLEREWSRASGNIANIAAAAADLATAAKALDVQARMMRPSCH